MDCCFVHVVYGGLLFLTYISTNAYYILGGMMSVFLMGVYDAASGKFRTVAKCGNGHDDATILRLQDELDMVKISKVSFSSGGEMLGGSCRI